MNTIRHPITGSFGQPNLSISTQTYGVTENGEYKGDTSTVVVTCCATATQVGIEFNKMQYDAFMACLKAAGETAWPTEAVETIAEDGVGAVPEDYRFKAFDPNSASIGSDTPPLNLHGDSEDYKPLPRNVVSLASKRTAPADEPVRETADSVLEKAKGVFEEVVVLGFIKDDNSPHNADIRAMTTDLEVRDVLYLLEIVKHRVLFG